jgi:pimeloyl-ACP methyl ester carboxylesterase
MTSVEYSEHEIESTNTRIVLSVWEPVQPALVIVFMPATMVHPLMYESLLSGFAKHSLAVVGVHPVGHGKSPRDVKRYTIKDIVQNGRDAVTFALRRYSQPVIVMGASQGGLVTAAIAAEDVRVTAAFPNNIFLSELPDSAGISRFPKWMWSKNRQIKGFVRFLSLRFPDFQVPVWIYLGLRRVCPKWAFWKMARADRICLKHYSLHFLSSLFFTHFPGITDGSIRCPLHLVIDSGDGLFRESYVKKVFELVQAPYKETITFDFNDHMFMVNHPKEACEKLSEMIQRLYC